MPLNVSRDLWCVFLLDNSQLCSGSRDNTVRLWDVNSQTCVRKNTISRNLVCETKFSLPLLVFNMDCNVFVFRLVTLIGQLEQILLHKVGKTKNSGLQLPVYINHTRH